MFYTNGYNKIITETPIYFEKDYLQEPALIKTYDKYKGWKTEAYYSINKGDRIIFQTTDVVKEEDFAKVFLGATGTLADNYFSIAFDRLLQRLNNEKVIFEILKSDPDNDIGEAEDLIYDFVKTTAVMGVSLKKRENHKKYCHMSALFGSITLYTVWKGIFWMPEDLWRKAIKDYILEKEFSDVQVMFIDMYKLAISSF